ncbi:hypothetical protein WMY93_008714 [Mugilogobius chulae]|uniref:THAP-type domain-containing protein n=1 Tax=Mugilogobius chulae TaxID=88201 RepID=A0AAW0PCT7_9GOBI
MNETVRSLWLAKIRRDNFAPSLTRSTRVCSRHFLPGDIVRTSGGQRKLRKGAVPVLFHWNNYSLPPRRLSVWERQPPLPPQPPPSLDPPQTEEESPAVPVENQREVVQVIAPDHDYFVTPRTGMRVVELQDEVDKLREENELLRRQMDELTLESRFFLERFAGSDEDIRFYTRFASYRHLQYFWRLIEPAVRTSMIRVTSAKASEAASGGFHRSTKLEPIDELFMFLMYLSVGLLPQDLAARFRVHRSTVSRIIATWTNFLYQLLGKKRLWLPREVVRSLLPPVFAEFSDTQVVLDCTEIYCQTPTDLLLQSELYSTYKSHTTLKAMIGMAPHGAITFVSSLYAGSMSDREIFRQSGIISVLQPDMAVMVDKGFLIDNLAPCKVYRPAYLSGRTQMSRQDVLQTQTIARLRVHVERCIRRVKENKLFDRVVPVSVCGSIDELFNVACFLVNYQNGPLVKAWAT